MALSLVSACVTQKKKDEAKGLKLFFHNLTAKYNGFFNAEVLVKDATEKLTYSHQDNFNKVLDVYPAVAVDNFQSAVPDLDKAIEKTAVAAAFHRPSHWVDDSYLLLGKAQHLKHDFQAAEESLQYLVDIYDPVLKRKITPQERKKMAEELKKEKLEARKVAAETARKEREAEAKERKETAEKEKKEKEETAKRLEKERIDLAKMRQDSIAKEAETRKKEVEKKKDDLDSRNESRRKFNEERTAARKKEREEEKKPKKRVELVQNEEKPVEKPKEEPKTASKPKVEMVKTGSNATPVFRAEDVTKMGKVKGKPDRYFLKHRPCHQEAIVWLARTQIERGDYDEAELLLDMLDKSTKTFKDMRQMVSVAKAHLHLKQKHYEAAIPALENAVALTKNKREKARLAYILAQVYQMTGNSDKAYVYFDKVLKNNPLYEMEFNARLSMALNTTTAVESTVAMLKKMARDDKNREYNDQIYYALAKIALKNNQKPEAIDYLNQAIAIGGNNKETKGEIYYLMAQLQFESENYVNAKLYFDSTTQFMTSSDSRRDDAARYASNLVDIARNIEIITLQDSLIRIANLSKAEQKDVAMGIKKTRLLRDAAKAQAAQPKLGSSGGNDLPQSGSVKSNFFAYNIDGVKKGRKEFDKKWGGDRKLEDNWRRSNKKTSSAEVNNIDVAISEISDKEVAEILRDVPKSKSEIGTRNLLIDDALYQLGTLYHDKLKNDKKAVGALEDDLKRYPTTKHELDDWYYLYLAYSDLGNKTKANEYYEKIQQKYSTSTYAQILKNPDSFKKKDEQSVDKYYNSTYTIFTKGDYKQVTQRVTESETTYGINNPYRAKFALLNAMSVGNLQGKSAYLEGLKEVIGKYKDAPEGKYAQELLRIMEASSDTSKTPKNTEGVTDSKFTEDVNGFHYVIITLPTDANIEDAKAVVADYNAKYHRLEDLKISSISLSLDPELPTLVIRRFKDKTAALLFTTGAKVNEKDFIKGIKYEVFAVTQNNYREILNQKSTASYKQFYEKFYKP
jgi:tetratricopeptide (TPR) repeat protein